LLYGIAGEMSELDGTQHLLDLYCGAGTIGLSLSDKVRRLTGIEIVPEAVTCAKANAELNGISSDRAHFFCADASDAESLLSAAEAEDAPPIDVAVIDPPRKGTTPELIDALCRRNIPRIVYVSCEPETLARDCALFEKQGYVIGTVQPVDLFPRTGHVESVVCLKKEFP
jgi:23S rRNA (uracil1939-C5)-methyltransferase